MSVFVKKGVGSAIEGRSVYEVFGHRLKTGEVGIEIEMEGTDFPRGQPCDCGDEDCGEYTGEIAGLWQYHEDHSLRGEDNAEYVLISPIKLEDTEPAINELFKALSSYGSELDVSNRTSLHIHLNFQKSYANHIAAFAALFFTFEDILSQWCGEHRVGNLFCLRAKDAPAIIDLVKALVRNNLAVPGGISDHWHYAGVNFEALQKFGSIEIRHMRGPTSAQEANEWVRIVSHLYRLSEAFAADPREICYKYSCDGPTRFFDSLFGPELSEIIRRDISMTDEEFRNSLREGIRMAQEIAFCLDWNSFTLPQLDPFGRKKAAKPKTSTTVENATTYTTAFVASPSSTDPIEDVWFSDIFPLNTGTTNV